MKISPIVLRTAENLVGRRLSTLNWIHTMAMRSIGASLARDEKADATVVDLGILFHDIGKDSVEFSQHAKEGAGICRKDLQRLKVNHELIDAVVHCVETHGWAHIEGDPKPKTKEAKIVFDADMIQQLGCMGIVKHILKHREEEFYSLIDKAKADLEKAAQSVLTSSGKKLVSERLDEVLNFFDKAEQGE